MLPLLAAAAAGGGSSQGGDGMSKSVKYLLVAIALAVTVYASWRVYQNYQEKKKAAENNAIDTKITPQQVYDFNAKKKGAKRLSASEMNGFYKAYARMYANQLRTAFNPSGYSWLISTDTTNNTEVQAVAGKIKLLKVPFSMIATAYYAAFTDDLNVRLQKELNPAELRQFYVRSGLQGIR